MSRRRRKAAVIASVLAAMFVYWPLLIPVLGFWYWDGRGRNLLAHCVRCGGSLASVEAADAHVACGCGRRYRHDTHLRAFEMLAPPG